MRCASPTGIQKFSPVKNTANHYSLLSSMFGKLLQPEAIFGLKMHKKRLPTGLDRPFPHGELA